MKLARNIIFHLTFTEPVVGIVVGVVVAAAAAAAAVGVRYSFWLPLFKCKKLLTLSLTSSFP